MQLVLGVDSSTQSTKVELRHLDTGAIVASGAARHPTTSPPVSEQDPAAWWQALVDAVGQLGDHRNDVVAISIAGQQHGLVLLDAAGRPLRPAKLWNDTTSAPQADALVEALGAPAWAAGCGSVPVAAFTVSKLAWVAEHEPDLLDRTAMVSLPHDYLTGRLTGEHVTDRGDASGTGWFDPSTGDYRPELLVTAGVEATWVERLPHVLGPGEAAGTINAEAAAALGLPAGVVVGPGTGDNMAAALGLGLTPGDVVFSLGTSGTVYAVSPTATTDGTGSVAGFADASGNFLPLVCTLNATKVTDTVARWLGTDASGLSEMALSSITTPTNVNAAGRRSQPVVLVPYFDGERTPNRPDATGSFHGLTNSTTPAQLARAAHDGVLCGLLDGFGALRAAGVETNGRRHLIGGGARSAAYRQRCADLGGAPVFVPDVAEAVATGACVQAASVFAGCGPAEQIERWNLGGGDLVEPGSGANDADAVRAAYAEIVDRN